MVKHRIIAALTACLTCAASLSLLPQSVPVRACEAVRNDFETSYNGWYGNADHVILSKNGNFDTIATLSVTVFFWWSAFYFG